MERAKINKVLYIAMLVLISGNFFIWRGILFGENKNLELYFLNVGQGDSELISFPGGAQILVDGGPDAKSLNELAKAMPGMDRRIELVIATHPEFDHFGGLIDVLENYEVGVMITNGRRGTAKAYSDFERVIAEKQIPVMQLFAGDKITYGSAELEVLWPTKTAAVGKKTNESGIVFMLKDRDLRALYTADIGFETEEILRRKYDLDADILKVGHHGSKYSTDKKFAEEVSPAISVIGVGKNSYGHPTEAALSRLASVSSQIFRTDNSGTIKLVFADGSLKAFAR